MRVLDETELLGDQFPRIENIPDAVGNEASETIQLAEELGGLRLLPWEKYSLAAAMRTNRVGRWSALDVGIVVARQNGKTAIAEARMLGGVALLAEESIVYSAHREETAMDVMERFIEMLQSHRDLERLIMRIVHKNGHQGIYFKVDGKTVHLRFKTRTRGSGRGTGGDLVFLDEAFHLPESIITSMMPTLSARANPQIWQLSSPPDMLYHEYCETLARLRRRALAEGTDPSLCYLEWSATPGPDPMNPLKGLPMALDDPRQLAAGNPSYGALITPEYVAAEYRSMDRRGFAVERDGIGFWPPDPEDDMTEPALIPEAKVRLHIADRMPLSKSAPMALALDMTPDRSALSVAAATQRRNLGIHLEIGRHEPPSRALTQYIISLVYRWDPAAIVIDRQSGAMALVPELEQAGIEPEITSAAELVQACGGIYDDLVSGGLETISFAEDPLLVDAIAGSTKRALGAGWAIDRMTGAVVSPFVAAALARYGLLKYAAKKPAPGQPFDPGGQGVSPGATDNHSVNTGIESLRLGQFGGGESLDISSASF
jgi:hypothetical protein